jgi:hypothetical protein
MAVSMAESVGGPEGELRYVSLSSRATNWMRELRSLADVVQPLGKHVS